MVSPQQPRVAALLSLEYPQSLAVYEEYAAAQKAVDFLSDNEFPVQNCMIVGTELKQVERITGRLTNGRVAGVGAMSGLWFGLFVGLIFSFFGKNGDGLGVILSTALIGAVFGTVWSLIGYLGTRGQRDFSSVTAVVATRYEVLVEHKLLAQAQELLRTLPGATPDPFA
ncbi:MAG: rane protein [Marmoricola sp.]|nr:rane protein [Marmoricola sp.]